MSTKVNTLIHSKFEQHRTISFVVSSCSENNAEKYCANVIWARGEDSKERKEKFVHANFISR